MYCDMIAFSCIWALTQPFLLYLQFEEVMKMCEWIVVLMCDLSMQSLSESRRLSRDLQTNEIFIAGISLILKELANVSCLLTKILYLARSPVCYQLV